MRVILGAVALGVLGAIPPAQAETLTDALISAYRNSHLLEQNQAVLRAADEDVATAVGLLLPVISYSVADNYSRTNLPFSPRNIFSTAGSISLNASLTLLDFGRGKADVAIKNELVLATQQSLVNIEQQVLLDAVSAYVNMGLQGELVAAQQFSVRLISQDLKAARDRFDVGEVTKTDVALAEAQLASANAALASSQGAYNVARERYNAAIGHYPDRLAALPRPPHTAGKVDEARALALRNHPVILQDSHQAKAADLGVDLARAQFNPTLTATLGASQAFDAKKFGNFSESVGLSFGQTLYAGGRLSSAFRQAIARQQQAHAALSQDGVTVTEAVGKAWSNILVANASISAENEQIRAALAAYDGVKQEAELGSRTTLDVLNAEQTLLSARAARLQAGANLYVSQYQLLSAMGLLTAAHLQLGIPTFDPKAYYNAVKNAPATSSRGAKLDRILKTLGK